MKPTNAFFSSHPPVGPGPLIVGVDVGGTKIAAGIVDAQGQVYGRVKLPTDTSRPEMTLQSIATAITSALHWSGSGAKGSGGGPGGAGLSFTGSAGWQPEN